MEWETQAGTADGISELYFKNNMEWSLENLFQKVKYNPNVKAKKSLSGYIGACIVTNNKSRFYFNKLFLFIDKVDDNLQQ